MTRQNGRPAEHRIRIVAHVLPATGRVWRAKAEASTLGRVVDDLLAPKTVSRAKRLGVTHRHE